MGFANPKLLSASLLLIIFFAWCQWSFGKRSPETVVTPLVDAAQVRKLQSEQENQGSFVIVDVRSKAETDVSMIPGAVTKSEFEKNTEQQKGKAVIVYCTVGVRSAYYVAALNREGWNAWNYKGSILDWCENDLPLTVEGKETNQVHTYSWWYSAPANYVSVH